MGPSARTPEDLEMLFEDAFVLRDAAAVMMLFEPGAVLARNRDLRAAHSPRWIEEVAAALWAAGDTYYSVPRRVLQAGDTALVIGAGAANVMHRGPDGYWRYMICLLGEGSASKS